MSSLENQIERDAEDILKSVSKGIGFILLCFFYGLYEIRKDKPFAIFAAAAAVPVTIFLGKHFFNIWDYGYVIYSAVLPVAVLLVLGLIYHQTQEYYNKIFTDVGFKGKDGRTPRCISKSTKQSKTTIYFKSNIPLATWNKNIVTVQTALDCNVLVAEQGRSKRIVKLVYVPADYDISDSIPWEAEYLSEELGLTEIVLGESISSQIKFNFAVTPHWILAGSTGSGKSVLMRLIVFQCIVKGFRIIIMDFKRGVEFGRIYDDFCEVIMDKKRAVEVLQSLVQENQRRLDVFREKGCKNIDDYNGKYKYDPLEHIVVFIDELAIALIPTRDPEDKKLTALATDALENLAILARAAGIYMVFGIQRPDANTVTGQIKSNVTGRVCGYFADQAPSLIVLGNTKANELPSKTKGRFMFQDGSETLPFQGYLLNDEKELETIRYKRKAAELLAEREAQQGLSPELRDDLAGDAASATQSKPPKHRKNDDMEFDYSDC